MNSIGLIIIDSILQNVENDTIFIYGQVCEQVEQVEFDPVTYLVVFNVSQSNLFRYIVWKQQYIGIPVINNS
jgi:hypothetical protein